MKYLFALALISALSACGQSGGGSSPQVTADGQIIQPNTGKPMASIWTRDQTGAVIDLRIFTFSTPFTIILADLSTELCSCTSIIVGTEATGRIISSGCTHYPSGATSPVCSTHEGFSDYQKANSVLTLTSNHGVTVTFH